MIKVGIIGYGYSAQTFHIPLIESTKGMALSAISSSKVDTVKNNHPSVIIFNSPEQLISSQCVDLIVITAPSDAHYPLAKTCLENHLAVIVEKPMTTMVEEAEVLLAIAEKNNLVLSVFHNRRWDSDFLTVRKLLKEQTLGEIKLFESHFDRFRPQVRDCWREQPGPASGNWYDLGSHLVDQALCLFGLPDSLTARCLPLREHSKTTDYFHVLLHYENFEVILHGSPFAAAPNPRFRCEGTAGSFVKYGYDPQEEQLKKGLNPNDLNYGLENEKHSGKLYQLASEVVIPTELGCYQNYYQQITNAINVNDHSKNPVNAMDAINVIKIIQLAEASSAQNKTVKI